MRIIECDSSEAAADLVAGEILDALADKPDLVLGLATGSTPIGVYERLVRAHRERDVDFSRVRTFNLDEYVGLSADHPQSYRYFMREHLFGALNIPPGSIHFPPVTGDPREACRAFERVIANSGGIDIQLLGIGSNGHIGFNEPTSSLASRTRIKTLADKTLSDNARFYAEGERQPQLAATMGIGTILNARRILLQSFGHNKAAAIKATVEGPVASMCPASALQLHADVSIFLDGPSASLLTMREYYRRVRQEELDLAEHGLGAGG